MPILARAQIKHITQIDLLTDSGHQGLVSHHYTRKRYRVHADSRKPIRNRVRKQMSQRPAKGMARDKHM